MGNESKVLCASSEDFARESIPMSERKNVLSPLIVWIGYVFFPTGIMAAITVTGSFTFSQAMLICIGSCILLGGLSSVTGTIGQREGLTFGLLSNFTFGIKGMKFPALLVPITLIGWDCINISVAALMLTAFFNAENLYWLVCLLIGILYVVTSIKGYRYINILGNVAVPAIVIFMGISCVAGIKNIGGLSNLFTAIPDAVGSMSLVAGLTAIVGTFAVGAGTSSPDIQRYCRNQKDSITVSLVTFCIAFVYLLITGGIAAIAVNSTDLVQVFKLLNLLLIGALAIFFLTWTTAVTDFYSAALGIAAALNIGKTKTTIVIGTISVILAMLRVYLYIIPWMTLMSAIAVPIGGVLAADYFIVNKGRYPDIKNVYQKNPEIIIPAIKISPFISWIIGCVVVLSTTHANIGIPPLFGWLSSFILHVILSRIISQPFAASSQISNTESLN